MRLPCGKPLESQAWRIAKVAFHCLVAAIFVIPAGLAWLAGASDEKDLTDFSSFS
jgi:hypothetical protein